MHQDEEPGELPSKTARKAVVRFNHFVRKHTHGVDLETLNQQGITKVNLLSFSKINEIIALAVERALEKYGSAFDQREASRIREEVKVEVRREVQASANGAASGPSGGAETPPAESAPLLSEILERRIEKLRNQLLATEAALERALAMKDDAEGVASIYRDIQGLKLADRQYEKKKGMLKTIFEDNYELQKAGRQ
jgi:hypothetical protein